MKIHTLSYFNKIYFVLNKYYFAKFTPRLKRVVNINSVRYNTLIIIEPFKIDNKYFTISPIWKRYLSIHSPDTKLIVMGFCDFQSRNYIDLLNLPKDFNAYVQNALPVSEDWEIPIDGADVREYLKRFFEGHGGNSLLSKLNGMRQTVNIARTQIINNDAKFETILNELLLPYAKPEWLELINRWQNYYPYFEYLPFYNIIKEINKKNSEISEFFTCNNPTEELFSTLDIEFSLNKIHKQLTELDKLYIRPEIYR